MSGLVLGRRLLGTILHSSNEPGELSQWLCHDDSTINIVLVIIIINTKNLRSFITVKAHCSMTHLKQQKSLGFF